MVFNEPWCFTPRHESGVHAPGLRDADLTLRAGHVVNLAHAGVPRHARRGAIGGRRIRRSA